MPFIFFENDIAIVIALSVIYFIYKGMHWHAMYALYMPALVIAVFVNLDSNQLLAGVIIGVLSNQVFYYLNHKLKKESAQKNG